MRQLREQADGFSQAAQTSMVDQAFFMVHQLPPPPPPNVFNPYALIGALEHQEDGAHHSRHADVRKFTIVLTSYIKLPPSPRLGDMVPHILVNNIELDALLRVPRQSLY